MIRKAFAIFFSIFLLQLAHASLAKGQTGDELGKKVKAYFEDLSNKLKPVAAQAPTPQNFRGVMKPAVDAIDGFYGATLVDAGWVIQQVYNPSHFLARGFDLKKVRELDYFYKRMREEPSPQLSEPGHGSLLQPRLISMRYPIIKDARFGGFISLMVRTESFLKATGLDKMKAYKIICLGKLAEQKGELSPGYEKVTVELPSTEWEIQYE